jgi:hypothetical protein
MGLWPGFRDFVFPPADRLSEQLRELAAGFNRLADELAELRQELRADKSAGDDQRRSAQRDNPRRRSPRAAA